MNVNILLNYVYIQVEGIEDKMHRFRVYSLKNFVELAQVLETNKSRFKFQLYYLLAL